MFLLMVLFLGAFALLFAFSVTAVANGPGGAARICLRVMRDGWRDLRAFSLRRVLAMANLAIKESLRRYVLIVFAVFAVILLFAGWYLDPDADNPAVLYISFVLKSTNYLLLLLAVLLSAFSIPQDVQSKTIYTIVTKPVRAWEIVLGRIVGFGAVGTALLILMSICSYIFVYRGIMHEHGIDTASIAEDPATGGWTGRTTREGRHRHEFRVAPSGEGQSFSILGHFHRVTRKAVEGQEPIWSVGPPQGALQARVPIYGELRFLNREGKLDLKGINVGKEFTYRGYVEGNSLSAGIFRFEGLRSQDFPQGLPLEMTIRVFRTYQGEIEKGIRGTLVLRNPATQDPALWEQITSKDPDIARESEPTQFFASEFTPTQMLIKRQVSARMADDSVRDVDPFESLVHDGKLDVVIQCDQGAQYFGMGRGDLYFRAADRSFAVNFAKTYVTLWFQMMIVIGFGVMFSTFLSGPVAMLATLSSIILGLVTFFVVDVAIGKAQGGGPLESMVRIFRQDNLVTDIDVGAPTRMIIKAADTGAMFLMQVVANLMPNFNDYADLGGINTSRFAAYGFDIPGSLMGQHLVITLAYLAVVTTAGYFFLKTKEIAA